MPLRNEAGFCERCATNEVGEAISKISVKMRWMRAGASKAIPTKRRLT